MDIDITRLEAIVSPYLMLVEKSAVEYISSPLADMIGMDSAELSEYVRTRGGTFDTVHDGTEVNVVLPGRGNTRLRLVCTRTNIDGASVYAFSPDTRAAGSALRADDTPDLGPVAAQLDRYSLDGFVVLENGHIVHLNSNMAECIGYDQAELRGRQFLRFVSQESRPDYIAACNAGRLAADAKVPVTEIMLTGSSGRRVNLTMNAGWVTSGSRELLWLVLADNTEKKRLQRRLKDEHIRLRELFANAPAGVLYISPRGWILDCNAFVSRVTGYARAEIKGNPFTGFVAPGEVEALRNDFRALYREGGELRRECVLRSRDGDEITIEYHALPVMRKGHKAGALMLFTDITEKRALEKELLRKNAENERGLWEMAEVKDALEARAGELNRATEEMKLLNERLNLLSITDGLTGVYNHRYFQERLSEEVERFARNRQGDCLSLLMLDIDDFKRFNDTYGHQCGDMILKQLAQGLRNAVRTIDIIARYGGEEFSVILPQTGLDDARQVAERICTEIHDTAFMIEDTIGTVQVTVSLGVATLQSGGGTKSDLIRMADRALYRAKRRGKDCVNVWEPN